MDTNINQAADTNAEYRAIAETDFTSQNLDDTTELEDRLVMVICDPVLTAVRIASLVRQQIDEGITEIPENHFDAFKSTLDALRLHGVLPALDGNHLTLDELIAVVNDPDALRQAHFAVINGPENDETFDERIDIDSKTLVDRCVELSRLPADQFLTLAPHSLNPRVMCFAELLGASTSGTPADASDELIYSQYRDRINIDATLAEIFHGLCRLILVDLSDSSGLAMVMKLPTLELNDGVWFWEQSIDDLFGRPMDGVEVRAFLIVANDTNRADFDTEEVRRFVRGLRDGPQKHSASKYLFGSTK